MSNAANEPHINSYVCTICGQRCNSGAYGGDTGDRMEDKKLCFTCNFWDEYVERKDDPRVVRTEQFVHYAIADEHSRFMRGFGGRPWWIDFHDGRRVKTSNLWYQGEIPEPFRAKLPPNAVLKQDGDWNDPSYKVLEVKS